MTKEDEGPNNANGVRLRLWPGIVAATVIVVGLFLGLLFTIAMPDVAAAGILASVVGTLVVFLWWLFFSRVPWSQRLGALAFLILVWFAMRPLLDKSIIGGAMGALPAIAFTVFAVALVVWAATTQSLSGRIRLVSIIPAMLIAAGLCTLVKTAGVRGGGFEFHWRWTPTPEERLLAEGSDEVVTPPARATVEALNEPPALKSNAVSVTTLDTPAPLAPADWPGFRGPHRDSVVHHAQIQTDWSKNPPVELWRRPIGPGWSSFAVDGDLLYTQEQRGDDEIVTSYRLSTGQPVWRHRDSVRFWESNAGAGPRATPTLANGRVYAFGATGILNALDAASGAVIWSRNAASDTGVEIPMWGFSSSPLVIGDVVITAAAGKMAAYEIATGKPRWFGPTGSFSYSSPHLVTINGLQQVVFLRGNGVTSVAPADGKVLWEHEWEGGAIVQPAITADGDLLISSIGVTGGQGLRRLAISMKSGQWTAEERWTSTGLKPYFNDFAVHNGHAFGFDGSILSCIDLADGKRKWKGGRYGGGQLVLLADQDLLLVLSDEGELALVSATTDEFREIGRFKAIEGKTWNHPVVVRDMLLVRNGEEMAAFRLTRVER
jgi:outer membrane protein assembly factor BamB